MLPTLRRLAFFDADRVRIRRDLNNGCLELFIDGRQDQYGGVETMTVTIYQADLKTPPPLQMLPDEV